MESAPPAAVLKHLESATDTHPLERKLLVCGSVGQGREILRALGRRRSWVGWEVTTPRRLSLTLTAPSLAARGLTLADDFQEQAAVGDALDRALKGGRFRGLRELAETPGFRQAVVNAVDALRLAGVDPDALSAARAPNPQLRDLLVLVLTGYLEHLDHQGMVDTAAVLEEAIASLDDGLDTRLVHLVPGLGLRGASGRLLTALMDRGATPLAADPVPGEVPPVVWAPGPRAPFSGLAAGEPTEGAVSLFAASGPADEIREILRRVVEAGLSWDQVEIIATDPVVYGGALHVLAERLGIPASFAVGLPVERTRPGRAVAAYLRWIQEDFPADAIRRLLEAGDLEVDVDPVKAARTLRDLRVGWGRHRYLPAINRRLEKLEARPRRYESEEDARDRVAAERARLEALRDLLTPILEPIPTPDADETVSPAELAGALREFLDRVATADDPSATARDRLMSRVDRMAATLTRKTDPSAAVAMLQRHLEIRVPAPMREGAAPWVSDGGHIHLSDVEHGGYSGRPATFVVGLDAERFPGAGLQDPLLPDSLRTALDADALSTSGQRLADRRFTLAACLARLRGSVTLSYSAWDPAEARAVAPAAVLLDAFRAAEGHPEATFDHLLDHLGDAASPVARQGGVDATDLWFGALEQDGVLRGGTREVRDAYPRLDDGLEAEEALSGHDATAYHGLVAPRPTLDPRDNPDRILSASGLQDLGTCGLRYLFKYVMRIRKPDDPEVDPEAWLNALDRGRLLHSVFESVLRTARDRGVDVADEDFEALALDTLEREARSMAREVPPPGDAVRERVMEQLRADVRSFVHMLEEEPRPWVDLELQFGLFGREPGVLKLPGGALKVRGAIDRVDETEEGLVVVDYKTGSPERYSRRHGTFNGGRRLQNAVYAAVADTLLEGRVARMEYHFPTRGGRNEITAFSRDEVFRGLGLVNRLLDAVAQGRFLPTEEGDDCRFCDYAPICRHSGDSWNRDTPRADWAERHLSLPVFQERRETRVWEETILPELDHAGD